MRTRIVRGLCSLSLCIAVLAGSAAALAPVDHKDERLGFKLQTPRDWTQIPQQVDERWVVAKFLSDKLNRWTDERGYTWEHKPDLQVIAFVHDALKAKEKISAKADKEGEKKIKVELEKPYKDYKDYLTRTHDGGGFFLASEEEIKLEDIGVTCLEHKVEKLSYDGPKRILTWVYHVPDMDIAVQFECLEDAYEKLKPEFVRCLRSFKLVPRTGGALFEVETPGRKLTMLDLDELKPEERNLHRIAMEREAHAKASANVPDGWVVKKMGRFLVINHADEKFAKRVVEHAEAVWTWLDATLGFIGPNEYVRSPIIRICKDWEEERKYWDGNSVWIWNNLEIYTHQDNAGSAGWEMEYVNRRVFEIWFSDKDRDLYFALPAWFGQGLSELLGHARSKTGKMEFRRDDWNTDELREASREGKVTSPRLLMTMGAESFGESFWQRRWEAAALVSFFVTGPASKNAKTKTLLADYLKGLKQVQLAIAAESDKDAKKKGKKPTTEAEEDAYFKKQRMAWKEKEKRVLDETFQKTFSAWKDSDWKQFDDAYFKSID